MIRALQRLLLLPLLSSAVAAAPLLHNAIGGAGPVGGGFTLESADGALSLSDLRGRPVLLYFGFTHCPDVCPMGLEAVSRAVRTLDEGEGGYAGRLQPLFITLDPERDRGDYLWNYVRFFHPRLIALRGEAPMLADVAERYWVRYRRQESGSASGYQIAHTDYLYLIDGEGGLRGVYDSFTPTAKLVRDIRRLLDAAPAPFAKEALN